MDTFSLKTVNYDGRMDIHKERTGVQSFFPHHDVEVYATKVKDEFVANLDYLPWIRIDMFQSDGCVFKVNEITSINPGFLFVDDVD